jgi:hypothetical protein
MVCLKSSALIFSLILLTLSSCNSSVTQEECQLAVFKAYKGSPKAAAFYKKSCIGKFELEFTQEKCQSALVRLMSGDNEFKLKKQFGQRVMECYSEYDLARFLKPGSAHIDENKGAGDNHHKTENTQK